MNEFSNALIQVYLVFSFLQPPLCILEIFLNFRKTLFKQKNNVKDQLTIRRRDTFKKLISENSTLYIWGCVSFRECFYLEILPQPGSLLVNLKLLFVISG